MAKEALTAALAMFVDERSAIPISSPTFDGQEIVAVDPVTAA